MVVTPFLKGVAACRSFTSSGLAMTKTKSVAHQTLLSKREVPNMCESNVSRDDYTTLT